MLLGMWLLFHAGIKANQISKRVLRSLKPHANPAAPDAEKIKTLKTHMNVQNIWKCGVIFFKE